MGLGATDPAPGDPSLGRSRLHGFDGSSTLPEGPAATERCAPAHLSSRARPRAKRAGKWASALPRLAGSARSSAKCSKNNSAGSVTSHRGWRRERNWKLTFSSASQGTPA